MPNSRYYSSNALPTTLTSGVTNSGTTIIVASTAGFPGSTPYTLALDYGAATMELVSVTGAAGLTLTVTRAYDGTSGASHNPGAVVQHVSSAIDFTDSRTHEASSSGVHGVTGTVVGTSDSQVLSNKTLTLASGSLKNISVFNQGPSGITQIIGDSLNPNASRLEIKDNEVALNTMLFVQSTGNVKSVKNVSDTDATYKFRLTDSDGTTDRFAVLAGGSFAITPTSTTTFPALDVVAPDTSATKRSFRVAASGGGTERYTIFNDGHTVITNQSAGQTTLKVNAAASPSVDIFNVSDSAANTLLAVQSTGKSLMNKGAVIAQPGVTSGAVLQVGGSNVGYTGNLEQWVGPGNTIVAQINETGTLSSNELAVTTTTWSTYTVTVANGGTATFTTTDGFFFKIGKMVFFRAYWVVNAAGSGATALTVTMPSTPFRSGSRQSIPGGLRDGTGTVTGPMTGLVFSGGAGAVMDRIVLRDGSDAVGTSLIAGSVWTLEGWYREA